MQKPARFHAKTVNMQGQVTGENALRAGVSGDAGDGYCDKELDDFSSVSNQAICGGVSSNIGFYFTVEFSTKDDDMTFDAHIPVDFGWGGIVVLDGKIIVEETGDIWQGGDSSLLDFVATLKKGRHLLEVIGGEGCCDGTTAWTFVDPHTGADTAFTKANLDNAYKGPPCPDCAYQRPSHFHVKTVNMGEAYSGEPAIRGAMAGPSGPGYCERDLAEMKGLSNQNLCEGGVNQDIGFLYLIAFSVKDDGTVFDAHIPVDFGFGGIVVMDGKVIVEVVDDIWQGGDSSLLDFSVTLDKGIHRLEVMGGEGCCDGATDWTFVHPVSGDDVDFTKANIEEAFTGPKCA